MPTDPATAARPPLTRDRIVAAAVALADDDGFDRLSMRRLAQALGVEAMSLYHHVANKDDLLDGMVDAVFSELHLPEPGDEGEWRGPIRRRCTSARSVLLRHPWALGRLDSRRTPGAATLRHHDAVISCLRGAGFSVRAAAAAFATIDAYVYGFVLQELSLPIGAGEEVGELAASIMATFDPGEYPALVEMATDHAQRRGYAFGDEFEPGLDLILDGLDARRRET